MNKMKTLITSVLFFFILEVWLQPTEGILTTGPNCVRDCRYRRNGNYQSCNSCHTFVQCSNHILYESSCPWSWRVPFTKLLWNDKRKRCKYKSKTCKLQDLPVDGGWGAWGPWDPCSVTCGGGERSRTRTCSDPAPSSGGQDCVGEATETETCSAWTCYSCSDECPGQWNSACTLCECPGEIIEGRATTDSPNFTPLACAHIYVETRPEEAVAITDRYGKFVIEDLCGEQYDFFVRGQGYAAENVTLISHPGKRKKRGVGDCIVLSGIVAEIIVHPDNTYLGPNSASPLGCTGIGKLGYVPNYM